MAIDPRKPCAESEAGRMQLLDVAYQQSWTSGDVPLQRQHGADAYGGLALLYADIADATPEKGGLGRHV